MNCKKITTRVIIVIFKTLEVYFIIIEDIIGICLIPFNLLNKCNIQLELETSQKKSEINKISGDKQVIRICHFCLILISFLLLSSNYIYSNMARINISYP